MISKALLSNVLFKGLPVLFRNLSMEVVTLPALDDNYMYLLVDQNSKECAVVDPVSPSKVLDAVKQRGLTLKSVLTTHHHWDHAGGNAELVNLVGHPIEVYGGSSKVQALTKQIVKGEKITVGNQITITCLLTPCHTQDHVCFHAVEQEKPESDGCVFTGDTLFLGGCGRFFEGTPQEMHHSLIEVLAQLPITTKVYCGHEYTANNLKFAKHIEPDNAAVLERIRTVDNIRAKGDFTVPGSIAEELATNPFMRVTDAKMQQRLNVTTAVEAMGLLRSKKDSFH